MDFISGLQALLGSKEVDIPREKRKMTSKTDVTQQSVNTAKARVAQLRDELEEAQKNVEDLQNTLDEQEKASELLVHALSSQRDEIDQLIVGVTVQIQEMMEKLEQQMGLLDTRTERQIAQISDAAAKQFDSIKGTAQRITDIQAGVQQIAQIREQVNQISVLNENLQQILAWKETLDALRQETLTVEKMEAASLAVKNDLSEKIHSENVKCYRNIKSLVVEMEDKMKEVELSQQSLKSIRRSFKGWKFFSFFAILDFALTGYLVLHILGFL